MLFDPPDEVGQLRISRVDFDQLRRVQYLFEAWHRSHLPVDELHIMAEAMRGFLDLDLRTK